MPASGTVRQYSATAVPTISQKFTGKERDADTGLDYFGARYLSSTQGRWMSPDKPFADQHPTNPQSWNLYDYVGNNPLRLADDTGEGAREKMAGAWLGGKNTFNNTMAGFIGLVIQPDQTAAAMWQNLKGITTLFSPDGRQALTEGWGHMSEE